MVPVVDARASRAGNARLGAVPAVAAALAPPGRGRLVRRRLSRLGRSHSRGGRRVGRRVAGRRLRVGRGHVAIAILGLELAPEFPRVTRGKGRVAALIGLRGVVVAVKDNPGDGLVGQAATVLRLGGTATVGLGLRRETVASVVLDKAVTHLTALGNAEDRVAGAVLVVVGYGLGAAVAAAEDSAREHRNGTHVVGTRARPRVRHGSAVAEAGGETQRLLNAKIVLNGAHHVVDKGDVLASLVAPPLVQTVGRDEDRAVVACHQRRQAVKGQSATATVGNLLGVTTEGMEGEDETVGLAGVVVVGKADNVLSLLAIDRHRVLAVADRRRLSAAGGAGTQNGRHARKTQESEGGELHDGDLRLADYEDGRTGWLSNETGA